ncbi:hypothetical protein COB21_02475 [Candidatus Aerophobetes bacterium]|uniref:UVR domain-containing protein n=1 Tax=Aerophobetes bacterium TaxID=2030807 RepID=A0A2A4X5C8_UNCAE|nr:MAG: hypothetical protein COB21_02475 [Candidatus Aerophobetes bacterium]
MSEKPLCCINCTKKVEITFKSFSHGKLEEMGVCKQCPWLAEKVPSFQDEDSPIMIEGLDKTCRSCAMTLKDLLMGELLGCEECYTTFSEEIAEQLIECDQVYVPKGETLTPSNISHSINNKALECIQKNKKLKTYRDNLDKALSNEDYESAATIRDEIKEYYKSSHE